MRRLLDAIGLGRGAETQETGDRIIAHRYRLIESMGRCGSGERFLAEDAVTEENVFVLLLAPAFADRRVIERLPQQDQKFGDLRILRPQDSGIDEQGRPYTVTRWVDGEPLSAVLRRGVPSWATTFSLFEELTDMFAVAHQRGLCHGSIEPGRVIVGPGGPWVLDFGLVRTLGGSYPGSAHYVAPELLDGGRPTAFTDQYSLAIILWEMVTGQPPFDGDLNTIVQGHRSKSLPELVRRDAPVEVDALLSIALSKIPDERFSDVSELFETLRGIEASNSGVWSLSSLSQTGSITGLLDEGPRKPSLSPTTPLGTTLRGLSVVELEAARRLIDELLAARAT